MNGPLVGGLGLGFGVLEDGKRIGVDDVVETMEANWLSRTATLVNVDDDVTVLMAKEAPPMLLTTCPVESS